MATYVQADQPLSVSTPLGQDKLLLVGFTGREAISGLFNFQLDLVAENKTDVPFDKLLGQKITLNLTLPDGKSKRYFNGICNRVSQGARDTDFTAYRMEIVPQFWLLTRRAQSRIFQHLSVPDILKKVLQGLDVTYEIQGTFQPRDYCVQYRETDFNFASRLMEEEGIYYFFKHTDGGHKMVLANTPASHSDLPGASKAIYETVEGGLREDDRVHAWEKFQELRSGKYTLWDHCFELPHKHLEAEKVIQDSVAVGSVTHKLKVADNDKLELYDYPGEYAQRFDGVDKGGGDQPAELQKNFQDNKRTAEIRMQQEALPSLLIQGTSTCRQFVTGHKFTLDRHFNANGQYVLTSVQHTGRISNYRSHGSEFAYHNNFTCIPAGLPYRPLRTTPKPFVQGTQTAVVAGPAGEEISCDKYGRVKVQFHWDRQGKNNADSACWCRVATLWAGKQWGVIHVPRIGQEVIVAFQEGDPDQPIIVGSVYNAEQMPPYGLPANRTQSGIKTRSSLDGSAENFNEICFEDKKGQEFIYVRAEKDHVVAVENDETKWVGNDRWEEVDRDRSLTVGRDKYEKVKHNKKIEVVNTHDESIGGNMKIYVGSSLTETVVINYAETVMGAMELSVGAALAITVGAAMSEAVIGGKSESVKGPKSETIGGGKTVDVKKDLVEAVEKDQTTRIGKNLTVEVGEQCKKSVAKEYILKAKKIQLMADDEVNIKTGSAELIMKKSGDITIKGNKITVKGDGDIILKGSQIKEN